MWHLGLIHYGSFVSALLLGMTFPPKLSNNYMSPDPLPTLHPPLPSLSEPTEGAQRSLLAET